MKYRPGTTDCAHPHEGHRYEIPSHSAALKIWLSSATGEDRIEISFGGVIPAAVSVERASQLAHALDGFVAADQICARPVDISLVPAGILTIRMLGADLIDFHVDRAYATEMSRSQARRLKEKIEGLVTRAAA